jgi:hypothetical protein
VSGFPYGGGNANPGGPGGRRARVRKAADLGQHSKKRCCSMVAAGQAARRGKYRLARRYAVMSVRLIAARVAR